MDHTTYTTHTFASLDTHNVSLLLLPALTHVVHAWAPSWGPRRHGSTAERMVHPAGAEISFTQQWEDMRASFVPTRGRRECGTATRASRLPLTARCDSRALGLGRRPGVPDHRRATAAGHRTAIVSGYHGTPASAAAGVGVGSVCLSHLKPAQGRSPGRQGNYLQWLRSLPLGRVPCAGTVIGGRFGALFSLIGDRVPGISASSWRLGGAGGGLSGAAPHFGQFVRSTTPLSGRTWADETELVQSHLCGRSWPICQVLR